MLFRSKEPCVTPWYSSYIDQTGRSRGLTSSRGPRTWVKPCVLCSLCAYSYVQSLPGCHQRPSAPKLKPSYGICRDTTTTHAVVDTQVWRTPNSDAPVDKKSKAVGQAYGVRRGFCRGGGGPPLEHFHVPWTCRWRGESSSRGGWARKGVGPATAQTRWRRAGCRRQRQAGEKWRAARVGWPTRWITTTLRHWIRN